MCISCVPRDGHRGFSERASTRGMPPVRRPWARPVAALSLLALVALRTAWGAAPAGCTNDLAGADDTACLRSGQADSDCCAPGASAACSQGYTYSAGETKCDGNSDNMITTCCLPSSSPSSSSASSSSAADECQVGTIRWTNNVSDHGSIWPNGSTTCPPCGPGRWVDARLFRQAFLLRVRAHASLIGGPPQILVVEHVEAWLHRRDKMRALLSGKIHRTGLRGTRVSRMCFGQVLSRRAHRVLELHELFDLAVKEYGPHEWILHL